MNSQVGKTPRALRELAAATLAAASALLWNHTAVAEDVWDNNGSGGPGSWSTALNWVDDTEPTATDDVTLPTDIPGNSAITLASGETAQSLTFNNSYTLSGGTLKIAGSPANAFVAESFSGTINTALVGTTGLTKLGSGTLLLGGSNTFTGTAAISAGTVVAQTAGALSTPTTNINNTGTLEIANITLDHPITMNTGSALRGTGASARSNGVIVINNNADVQIGTGASVTDVLTIGNAANDLAGGVGGSASITVIGAGKVVLTQDNSGGYAGSWSIASGTLEFSADNQLGTPLRPVTVSGGTLSITATIFTSRPFTAAGGTFSPASGTTLSLGAGLGSDPGALTKEGLGQLSLNSSSSRTGPTTINAGTVHLAANAGLGTGTATVNAGGTFQITSTSFTSGGVILNNGATFRALGNATYSVGSSPQITTAAADVNMTAAMVGNVFTIGSTIRNVSAGASAATIHVDGPGRLRLNSGGISGSDIYGRSWEQSAGILQVGSTSGSAINALGFKNGDAKQGNTITVNGGTLAVGALGSGAATPTWLRANVVLAGGAIASTNGITAEYGGDLATTASTTSRVLLFDPVNPATARNVTLRAGLGGVDHNPATTHWAGTLVLDPGTTTGGTFTITRTGGTILVDPGALIQVNPGATLDLAGIDALSDGADHVNILNNSLVGLSITSGAKNLGNIDGSGNTTVSNSSTLNSNRVRQSSLAVNDTSVHRVRAGLGNNSTSTLNTLPTLASTARFDLNDSRLIIQFGTSPSPLSATRTAIIKGRGGTDFATGDWNGPGGIGSFAASPTGGGDMVSFAIGYVENSFLPTLGLPSYTTFGGQTVDASSMLIRFTRGADANLDGRVNTDDITIVGALYNNPGTGHWFLGDFDYDGICDTDDVTVLGAMYDATAPPLSSAQLTAQFGSDFAAAFERGRALGPSIPEPTSPVLLLSVATSALASRRRRPTAAR